MLEGELRGTGAGLAVEPTASQDVSGAGDWQGLGLEPRQASAPRLAEPQCLCGPEPGGHTEGGGHGPQRKQSRTTPPRLPAPASVSAGRICLQAIKSLKGEKILTKFCD